MSEPTLRIPKQHHENYGLFRRGETFYVHFYLGKRCYHRSTGTQDEATARLFRDTFYENMRAEGAVCVDRRAGNSGRRRNKSPMPLPKEIYYRKPFQVVIGGKRVGDYLTLTEALKAKREYEARFKANPLENA